MPMLSNFHKEISRVASLRIKSYVENKMLLEGRRYRAELMQIRKNSIEQTRKSVDLGTHLKSGAVLPKPKKNNGGVMKVFSLLLPFILFGGMLSSTGAEILHKYDIFSPED